MAEAPNRAAMLAAIRKLWEQGSVVHRSHFHRRADQREIPHSWLPKVFETAEIIDGPTWNNDYGNWSVTIRGTNADDESVRVALGVDLAEEVLFLVTAY